MVDQEKIYENIIIGGGQYGLSVAYFLRRKKVDFLLLDAATKPGGGWPNTWDSLKLFSPSAYSSLSGWQMPTTIEEYPTKDEFIAYLEKYEARYGFPIKRGVLVHHVRKEGPLFRLRTNRGDYLAKTLVSATGTADSPFIPAYPNYKDFNGEHLHSVAYRNPSVMEGKRVLVVGGGNSAAQLLAEVSKVAQTVWVTQKEPTFLSEEIDGRFLFNQATATYLNKGNSTEKKASLGDIVQVASVKEGLKRGIYHHHLPFSSFYERGIVWEDGKKEPIDVVLWCTGFNANLKHLDSLGVVAQNKVATQETRSVKEPHLWLVGYGNWTGFASATIYGVGKTAKQTVNEIYEALHPK